MFQFFPKQWLHWRGSYGKGKGRVLIGGARSVPEVSSAQECRFQILCWFRLRRLAQSLRRGNRNVEGIVLPGVRVRFRTWTSVCMAGARNPSLMEVRNVSLRGRCKESDTLWKSWQAQYFVAVAKTLAGVCHSKDCVLGGRCRESVPWILYFEVKGLNSWEGLHLCNLSLRMRLRGQCSISYDLGSWFRGRRSTSEAWFRNVNPLRRSCVSSARNAGEIAFFGFEVQPSAEIVRAKCAECRWNCDFGFRSATLCGDRACQVRGMQVKLRFRISKCNPLRRSCVSIVRNAGKVAISDVIQRSCTRGPTESWCRHPDREILHKRSSYRDLAQEVLEHLDADICQRDLPQEIRIQKSCTSSLTEEILTQKPCTRDPHTEILRKRSCKILMQTSWQRDLGQEIRRQRSCTRGPIGSWCRHHDREILDKRSSYRDFAQVVLQDPDAEILTERSCTRDPHTEILHKRSYRIPTQTSWQRDLALEIHIQRSCTRGHTGSRCRHDNREILHKRSADRDLAQKVLLDPNADIMIERSCTRDPHTEILHKWSYRILMQRSWQRDLAQEIHIQRSCTRGPHTEILHKRSYRILMQTP